VREEVALVMGLEVAAVDVRRGLFEMGLDSLMALDLKNRLRSAIGLDVPATVVFEFPTVEAMAGYLDDRLSGTTLAAGMPAATDGTTVDVADDETAGVDMLARIRELSDQEVERQFEQTFSARSRVP
jgi:aryl carrier-like protein